MGHAGRDDFQTGCFETGIDLANDILGNGVRLDDGKSAFNSQFIFLEWGLIGAFCLADKAFHSNPDGP